jgi:hypothetical protein
MLCSKCVLLCIENLLQEFVCLILVVVFEHFQHYVCLWSIMERCTPPTTSSDLFLKHIFLGLQVGT